MPAKARPKKKGAHRASNLARSRNRKRNPGTRVIVVGPRSNKGHSHRPKRRNRRNPAFFGQHITPMKMGQYIAGGLIGVTINRAVLPLLPSNITSNNIFATIAAFVLAVAEWWAFSFVSPDFGSAVGFGGLMNAGSTLLNNFVPTVGSTISLSGRGTGDLVPSQPGLPFWPSAAQMGPGGAQAYMGGHSAYPNAYGA